MPPNTFRVHTEYVLVKSVGPKVLQAESGVQGTGEYFPPLQFHAKIVEAEIGGVALYRPFGKFRRANSYCHLMIYNIFASAELQPWGIHQEEISNNKEEEFAEKDPLSDTSKL
ncbi:uncharacterized protein TNCV_3288421 [Trichonephila clavipes]|nr:uncharacterized protein TNCV_3288421 [Trichonephila clavipes]